MYVNPSEYENKGHTLYIFDDKTERLIETG